MKERFILYGLSLLGIILLPATLRKEPKKDWIIVFLLKAFISSILGNIIASKKLLEFPIRIFPKAFKSSVMYDCLIFPLLCVYYNQTTYKSKLISIISQAFMYSVPMSAFEYVLEKKTNVIKYHTWNWYYTLISLVGTFLSVRGTMEFIRNISKNEES